MAVDLSTVLKHYKRKEIQEAIVSASKNREVAVSFGGAGYGKRPDTLKYPSDVLEFVKQGATSFHCSEEIWNNPLQIVTGMRKAELDSLRTGWDLVLDIDCPNWTLSKVITALIVRSLKDHGINSVSVKFSGNKGFHIGVPFEAMPGRTRNNATKDMFPDGPRSIAKYLIDYIGKKYTKVVDNSAVEFGDEKVKIPLRIIADVTGKKFEDVTNRLCSECGSIINPDAVKISSQFVCRKCETSIDGESSEMVKACPKCSSIMERIGPKKALCKCGSNSYQTRFDPSSILEVDTILIASRHLYRMPYSLNEKSGLVSIPIDPDKVMSFEKDAAKPENAAPGKFVFLDAGRTIEGEAENLLLKSIHYAEIIPGNETGNGNDRHDSAEIHFEKAVPAELFPPCIHNILKGISDGKKRSVFVLLNFLTNLGWGYDQIEALLKEWNSKNPEPLREVVLVGQLRYHKANKKRVLPPNCDNMSYYKGFGVCSPDRLCGRIKNPVSYSIRKARFLNSGKAKDKEE